MYISFSLPFLLFIFFLFSFLYLFYLFIFSIYFTYLFYYFFFPLFHGSKMWFHPGSNRGPSLRQSDVITNYTMKPNKHKNDMYYTKQYIWNHFLLSLLSLLSPPLFLFLCSPSCFVLFCFVLFSFLSFFFYFIYFIYIFYNIMLCCVVLCCIDSGSIL